MEIHNCCCYIFINCALFFPCFLSKPVSLNDLIAAEEQSVSVKTPQFIVSETKTDIRQLPKKHEITLTKHMTSGSIAQPNIRVSPLKYKKTFQIRSPLRPKKIKYSHKPLNKRINTTSKREIDNDEKFNRNYVPLLKSLSVLFNNLLRSDSGTDDDTDKYYNKQLSNSRSDECPCACKPEYKTTDREPAKKATTITSSITSTIPATAKTIDLAETSSTSAYNTITDNISPLRWNKNVPILSTRDSISSWRNYNGFGEGSLSTYHRNFEGHIAGNNGSDENNNSGRKATKSYTENYKQYTNRSSGDDANCNGSCRAIGRNRYITSKTANETPATETATTETIIGSNETFRNYRGDSNQFKGYDKFKARENKTESRILLSKSCSRLRRYESQEETTDISWKIEIPKENIFDVTYNVTRNQPLFNRYSTVAPQNQEIRGENKKLTLGDISASLINTSKPNLNQDKQKIVVIYDGYSVARDVNGENKLTEKAYRIHS